MMHVSFLTSLGDKESRQKALNHFGHTVLPINMQNHNQGEAAVMCLGGEQSPCALKWE